MKKLAFLLILLSGCASIDRYEMTWQTLHAIDVAQTVDAMNDDGDCYRESGSLTSLMIGTQPSERKIYTWGLASAAMHFGLTWLLNQTDINETVKSGIKIADIGYKASVVEGNHAAGVRLGGANHGCEPPAVGVTLYRW